MPIYHAIPAADANKPLQQIIAELGDTLQFGHALASENGAVIGWYCETPSSTYPPFALPSLQPLIDNRYPLFRIASRSDQDFTAYPRYAYSLRHCLLPDGTLLKQALVESFSEATWINIGTDAEIIPLSEQEKNAIYAQH